MAKSAWVSFPYPADAYAYEGGTFRKAWARLHRGDREPFPKSDDVQGAWRAYHAGRFGRAVEQGLALGVAGYNAANKAAAVYATYLEKSEARRLKLLEDAMQRAEASVECQRLLPLCAGRGTL